VVDAGAMLGMTPSWDLGLPVPFAFWSAHSTFSEGTGP
jgi:hypothetical protein